MAKFENFEQVEEAIAVLAQGHMELEAALNANLKLGELVRLQDAQIKTQDAQIKDQDTRIKALVALVDYDHQVLSKLAGLPPRPTRDPLAN